VPHAATEIPERRMQQQMVEMVVVAHQTISMRLDSKPVLQVSQQLKKPIAMRV